MKRSLAALLPALILVGCSGSPAISGDGDAACTGKCDGVATETILFTCEPEGSDIVCKSALPADFPVSADLTLATLDGTNYGELKDGRSFRAPAGTKVMAMVTLGAPQSGLFHADGDSDALDAFNRKLELPAGKSSYALPYDLWRVQLSGDAFMANAELEAQSIGVAPWQTFLYELPKVERAHAPLPYYEKKAAEILVLVERGRTSISGKATFCDSSGCSDDAAFTLSGSGPYVVSKQGLARPGATPSDPTPSDPTPSDPTPSDPTPSDPTPSDPTPTDPTPDCGGEGQAPCKVNNDYVCDEHFVYANGSCHACGQDGQIQCKVNSDYVCDEHFVYSNGLCHSCGQDGQIQCRVNGDYVCDEHCVYANGLCHSCGKEGQIQCRVNGDYVCDEHFVYANGLCRACGKESEPLCYINGNYLCDEGFSYSNGLCHAS